jgi:hypothetical protein
MKKSKKKKHNSIKDKQVLLSELDDSSGYIDVNDVSIEKYSAVQLGTDRNMLRLTDDNSEIDINIRDILRDEAHSFTKLHSNGDSVYLVTIEAEKDGVEFKYASDILHNRVEAKSKKDKVKRYINDGKMYTSFTQGTSKITYGREKKIDRFLPISLDSIDAQNDIFIGFAAFLLVLSLFSIFISFGSMLLLSLIWGLLSYTSKQTYTGHKIEQSTTSTQSRTVSDEIDAIACRVYDEDDKLVIKSAQRGIKWQFNKQNGIVSERGKKALKQLRDVHEDSSQHVLPVAKKELLSDSGIYSESEKYGIPMDREPTGASSDNQI